MEIITILDLLKIDAKEGGFLQLKCIAGKQGLGRRITASRISRPGLPLSGFFDSFSAISLQVFGRGEQKYLAKLESEGNFDTIDQMFSYDIPCCIFSDSGEPTPHFAQKAEEVGCPILQSPLLSSALSRRIYQILDVEFAPAMTIHGVLVEVFGIGVLLTGESGVGKSETALELLERGHRLICDDIVKLRNINDTMIIGSGENAQVAHHMEIRGLGIINVPDLYGIGAIREKKQVQLWAELEDWDPGKDYERLSGEDTKRDLLGIKIPYTVVPVKPGRNIPIIIETAARLQRLEKFGFHVADKLDSQVMDYLESRLYRSEDM
ncbi:MAG: HPr(Ser) kinase/phosphatase [Sphaerochaetaceae bacterium]|jgi:HPr kinase/phosphorylase|nr:HPr(Ser) kinase/phosphatase [Sphaerochaetaceae bacterium]MDD4007205.1 HPr(Ser) kinase/phosphatase [Sphaerochaetaceae bacterium]